jgi:hypothetical protein
VTNPNGEGFRTLLGWDQALDLQLRVAVTRLRGVATT